MLLTKPQLDFQTAVARNMSGEPLNVDAPYQDAYADWSKENDAILPKLSAEERTQTFSDQLAEKIHNKEKESIEATVKDPSEKKELLGKAQRGQLLWASSDEGKTFEVLTLEEAKKKDPLKLQIISSTLRSTSTNLEEIVEEQELLSLVKKYKDLNYTVGEFLIENHELTLEVTPPTGGEYTIGMTLGQDFDPKPMNGEPTHNTMESQLPEQYGEASSLQEPIHITTTTTGESENPNLKNIKKLTEEGILAAFFANEAKRRENHTTQLALQRLAQVNAAGAQQNQANLREHVHEVFHQNVVASKATREARQKRQEKQMEGERQRMKEREVKHKAAQEKADRKARQDAQQKQNTAQPSPVISFPAKAGWAALTTSLLAAGAAGGTVLLVTTTT